MHTHTNPNLYNTHTLLGPTTNSKRLCRQPQTEVIKWSGNELAVRNILKKQIIFNKAQTDCDECGID